MSRLVDDMRTRVSKAQSRAHAYKLAGDRDAAMRETRVAVSLTVAARFLAEAES